MPCESKNCNCTKFKWGKKKVSKKFHTGVCTNCSHVHKPFKTYSDLGGLPVLLVRRCCGVNVIHLTRDTHAGGCDERPTGRHVSKVL